ncbi:MAG TPA: glucuronate isomerase [Bryobacteraceae bacterium]|nr:glucuronate isomerase [Bryobacteraceae bacterium]
MPQLHPDRLFPADPETRSIARRLYESVAHLPIISPHGHTQPQWFAENQPFPNPAELLIVPDHYIYRMLYSRRAIRMEDLGLKGTKGLEPRELWRKFAEHYYLFRGTPTRLWLDYAFETLFDIRENLSAQTADLFYDRISEKLALPEFRPRALYERFQIEVLTTTDSAIDSLPYHRAIRESGWHGRILPTFRPDAVVDPDFSGFAENVAQLGTLYNEDTQSWDGYLRALQKARAHFKQLGATATDHGHPTANTANLERETAAALFRTVLGGSASADEREQFRAQMLTEMARMSVEDGLVMQIHPGSFRNHNEKLYREYGRDVGADIPTPTDYVRGLKPLLDRFGNELNLSIILFTLDESAYGRELAPLAGHYPALLLGPPWWFYDSPEGMMRFREYVTETAGFYNTVGFNDDTRAFLSIPARHDVARRMDAAFLAKLVVEHRIEEDEAFDLAFQLTNGLVRKAYRL